MPIPVLRPQPPTANGHHQTRPSVLRVATMGRVADRLTSALVAAAATASAPTLVQPVPAAAPFIHNTLSHTPHQPQQVIARPVPAEQPANARVRLVYYPEELGLDPVTSTHVEIVESEISGIDEGSTAVLGNDSRSTSTVYSNDNDEEDNDEEEEDEYGEDMEEEEEQDEFILEEGGGAGYGDSSPVSEMIPQKVVAAAAAVNPSGSDVQALEWHIRRTMVRLGNVATAREDEEVHSGVIELEIERGRIMSQTPCSGADSLITVMHSMECVPSLECELNYLNRRSPTSWKPSPRDARVRSDGAVDTRPTEAAKHGLKRQWESMDFDLELDAGGQYRRAKSLNLKCEESIVGNSSDDLSDSEPSIVPSEAVLMPSAAEDIKHEVESVNGCGTAEAPPLVEIKAEPVEVGELPVMLEGRQMFNSEPSTLEATKAKVRECFRPSEMGPEPNGFDFLYWQSNVGFLFGSNLSFYVNALGIMDLKKTKPSKRNGQLAKAEAPRATAMEVLAPAEEATAPDAPDTFWQQYMEDRRSFAAPLYLFKHTLDEEHCLRLGMVVELIHPLSVGFVTMGTVSEVLGGRVGVSLQTKQSYYFNRNSWRLFPVGTAAATGMPTIDVVEVERKPGVHYSNASLVQRIKKGKGAFKENWQVEAYDWNGRGSLRPATIRRIIRNRLLIVFNEDVDENEDGDRDNVPKSSYWCADDSPLLRPVDYHLESGRPFSTVQEDFQWPRYLRERKVVAAPLAAFRTRPSLPFSVGMQLEAVDRINPQVMRPATVSAVREFEIQVQYDGFPEERDQSFAVWTWDDSEDLFPVQWCLRHLHVLAVAQSQATHCKRGFCADVGNRNAWRLYHSSEESCPYRMPDYLHNFQRDPVLAARFTRHPKLRQNRTADKVDLRDDIISALEEKVRRQAELLNGFQTIKDYGPRYKQNMGLWREQAAHLPGLVVPASPLRWSCDEVERYINSVPQCAYLGSVFAFHEIDGEALLSLTERDLIDVMGLKQGVVVKIHSAIVKLRTRVMSEVFRSTRTV